VNSLVRKPVFFLLESQGFDCELYNAAQVKALPGRPKTDPLTMTPASPGRRVAQENLGSPAGYVGS